MNLFQRSKRILSAGKGITFELRIVRTIRTSHIPETVWQNFHRTVWKIFGWSEIPTRPSTENLVQVCITLPFLGSSGTSLLVNCGNSLASITPSSVVAGGLVWHSFSRLGVTESWGSKPRTPTLSPGSGAILDL